jgi:hypothetical protein
MNKQTLQLTRGDDGVYRAALLPDETHGENPGDQAKMEKAGILDGMTAFKVGGVQIGEAVVGGASALIVGELTDAFINPAKWGIPAGAVKLIEAWMMVNYGKKVLGVSTANMAGMFLAFDGIRDIVPLETWIQKGILMLQGKSTTPAVATQNQPPQTVAANGSLMAWLRN